MFRSTPPEAGQFAREHFEELYRPWRRRARLVFPIALIPLAAWVAAMAILFPHLRQGAIGGGIGAAMAMAVALLDSPPEWIDKWRRGWHGERNTAKALRPLERRGWTVVHGLMGHWRDRDHVAAGPAGVFLLETKNLTGRLSVESGVLTQQHGEDPIDSRSYTKLAGAVRGAAMDLQRELARFGVRWVTPVVVVSGDFAERVIERDGVVYLDGRELRGWLERQPIDGQRHHLGAIAAHLRSAPRAERIVRG